MKVFAKKHLESSVSTLTKLLNSPKFLKCVMGFMVFTFVILLTPYMLYANPLIENPFTQGAVNLLNDFGPLIALVSVGVGVAVCGYCLLRRAACDEQDAKKWGDRGKVSVICGGAAAVVTVALPPIINHYFGIS